MILLEFFQEHFNYSHRAQCNIHHQNVTKKLIISHTFTIDNILISNEIMIFENFLGESDNLIKKNRT